MEQIEQIVKDRIAFINAHKEKLVEAFIAETGLMPSQCELIVCNNPEKETVTYRIADATEQALLRRQAAALKKLEKYGEITILRYAKGKSYIKAERRSLASDGLLEAVEKLEE